MDLDDILGAPEPARRGPGRPTNAERARMDAERIANKKLQTEIRLASTGRTKIPEEEFLLPVSMNFLGRVLHMDPMTVKKRLRSCKPAGVVGNGRPVYLFHEALPYLVKPKMDLATYIKTLNPTDMPNSINKTFWEAERIKNKVLIETGEAWDDAAVLDVLGTTFMMFKDRLPLILEGMREAGLTDEQFAKLQGYVDQLQTNLHENLVDLPKQRRTLARVARIDPGDVPTGREDDDDSVDDEDDGVLG